MIDHFRTDLRAAGFASLDTEPFETTEVRWFAAGSLPRSFVDWFTDLEEASILEIRSDTYWTGTGQDRGIKRRGGSLLEVKERFELRDGVSIDEHLVGRVEVWKKERYENAVTGRMDESPWVVVDKVVLTRRVALAADGRLVPSAELDPGRPGCDIELASVMIDGIEGWTFAFEAYGPPQGRLDLVRRSALKLTGEGPYPVGFVMALGRSMGYPEWLGSLGYGAMAVHSRGA